MARIQTWEISDNFWELVEPLIPTSPRLEGQNYTRKPGGVRERKYSNRLYFSAIVYVLRTGIIWNALPREKFEGVGRQWFTASFSNGPRPVCFWTFGDVDWRNMMRWKESLGFGKLSTVRTLKHLLRKSPSDQIRPIGEKNGTKRSVLVDEHGVPLSLVVSGANRHDSVSLGPLLKEKESLSQRGVVRRGIFVLMRDM